MTPQEWAELLPLIQAFAGGKTIQLRDGGTWSDATNLAFDKGITHYRIKPNPRNFFLIETQTGFLSSFFYNKDQAHAVAKNYQGGKVVEVEEIPE